MRAGSIASSTVSGGGSLSGDISDNVEDEDADDCARTLAPPAASSSSAVTTFSAATAAAATSVSSSTPCVPISSSSGSNSNNNAAALWQSGTTGSEASTPGTPQMAASSLSSINAHTPTYRASSDTEKKRTRPGSVPLRKSLSQGGVPESEQVHPHSQLQQRGLHCNIHHLTYLFPIKFKIIA